MSVKEMKCPNVDEGGHGDEEAIQAKCEMCPKWEAAMQSVISNVDSISQTNAKVNESHVNSLHLKMDKVVELLTTLRAKQDEILKLVTAVSKREALSASSSSNKSIGSEVTEENTSRRSVGQSAGIKRSHSIELDSEGTSANVKQPKNDASVLGLDLSQFDFSRGFVIMGGRFLADQIHHGPKLNKVWDKMKVSSSIRLFPSEVGALHKLYDVETGTFLQPVPSSEVSQVLVIMVGHVNIMHDIKRSKLKTLADGSRKEVRESNADTLVRLADHISHMVYHFCSQLAPDRLAKLTGRSANISLTPASQTRMIEDTTCIFAWRRVVCVTPVHPHDQFAEVFDHFADLLAQSLTTKLVTAFANFRFLNLYAFMKCKETSVNNLMYSAGDSFYLHETGFKTLLKTFEMAGLSASGQYSVLDGDLKFCYRCMQNHSGGTAGCRHQNKNCRLCNKIGHLSRVHEADDAAMQYLIRTQLNEPLDFASNIVDSLVDKYVKDNCAIVTIPPPAAGPATQNGNRPHKFVGESGSRPPLISVPPPTATAFGPPPVDRMFGNAMNRPPPPPPAVGGKPFHSSNLVHQPKKQQHRPVESQRFDSGRFKSPSNESMDDWYN